MTQQRDTILIVDDDSGTRTLLREQVFSANNFLVAEAKDGPEALQIFEQHIPDLVILDLQLPGLSGRDLLVALTSQGYRGPLIVIADSGSEREAVEAFRLGATDYVTRPIRETEVLMAVERALVEVRLRRRYETLRHRLDTAHQQLEARITELTTLYDIGQSVTALHDLKHLFDLVLDGAISVTNADHAFLLLRDGKTDPLILRAGRNMRLAMLDRLGEPIQDQLADLVMTSREPLIVAGNSLRRFTTARDLYAVAYVPLAVQTTAIGVLAVGNHITKAAFDETHGYLLTMLADYTTTAIVNARLFGMQERRAHATEATLREVREHEAQRRRQLQVLLARLHQPLVEVDTELARLARGNAGRVSRNASARLVALGQRIKQLSAVVAGLTQRPRE